MTKQAIINDPVKKRIEEIRDLKKEIISLAPDKALDRILDEKHPAALVHSFSEEDFYFLIHDIGVEDSLELLSLASNRQWQYIIDNDIWEKDKIYLPAVTRWLNLMIKADPKRLIRWMAEEEPEFIEYYLFKNIRLAVREHDQDPSELGKSLITYDDVYYVSFIDSAIPSESGYGSPKQLKSERDEFIMEFLRRLSSYDHIKYQMILLESTSVIPAEAEEEMYRLRNIRRAEKGFEPFDEAMGIYQPVKPTAFGKAARKVIAKGGDYNDFAVTPLYPAGMLDPGNFFVRALNFIDNENIRMGLQTEFAGLCNKIISADQKIIREKEELSRVIRKASGYINIGLEILAGENGKVSPAKAAAFIEKYPLLMIFQAGYGEALKLKWEAEKWRKKSWFESRGLSLSFWDEKWLGILGGLLIKKPMFFDDYKTGVLYREFESLDEIGKTRHKLYDIIAVDDLLKGMEISPKGLKNRLLTWKNLLLTLWAASVLKISDEFVSIPDEDFTDFFADLWQNTVKPKNIKQEKKEAFLKWLSKRSGMDIHDIAKKTGVVLEELFNEITDEYGFISEDDIDPKYFRLFLLS